MSTPHTADRWRAIAPADAVTTLNGLFDALMRDPSGERFDEIAADFPGYRDASLRFFADLLDPPAEASAVAPRAGLYELIPVLVMKLDDAGQTELIEHILFTGRAPGVYRTFAAAIRLSLPPERVERALLASLERPGDPWAVDRARDVYYYVFSTRPDYPLSDAARARLAAL